VAQRVWVYVGGCAGNKPPPAEKAAITAACEKLIAEELRPRFLPEVRPSATFNYPVAIEGKWLGNTYRFFTRYRSDDPASLKPEFDAPFARLDYVGRDCFDLMWPAHRRMALRVRASIPNGSAASDRQRAVFPTLLT
jgi:hypothetical protein